MAAALTLALIALVSQPSISAQRHEEPVPASLSSPIRDALADGGIRAAVSGLSLDFWFVKALPVKAGSADASWSSVEEGALVGVVRTAGDFRDIRGRLVKPGLYTLRYGIQPQNGDHLGVSPFREFLLLSPAAIDATLPARGHEATVEMSIRTAGGSHPAAWSIDPPRASQDVLTTHATDLGHTALIVEVPVALDTSRAGALRFGIVLIGRVDA